MGAKKFETLPSFQLLTELAKNPFDLTEEGALSPARIEKYVTTSYNWQLLYGTQRINDQTWQTLLSLAKEAKLVNQLEQLQDGSAVNRNEDSETSVLHTAMRDFFDNRNSSAVAREASEKAYHELEKLSQFLKQLEQNNNTFTTVIQIGIGGSSLGPEAIYEALRFYKKDHRQVLFISNIDPDQSADVFKRVVLKETLVVVVSKSGNTLETKINEAIARDYFKQAGLNPKKHFIAVTQEGSPMDDPIHYLASFYIWDYIGGRYSVTSMVGAVCLAFALGMDRFLEFLRGANSMDRAALASEESNLPLHLALIGIWNRNFLGHTSVGLIPYSQALVRFPAHLQQLDMESNGKEVNQEGQRVTYGTGPIVWGEPGTNCQHSFFQSVHQGSNTVPLELIGFRKAQRDQDLKIQGTFSQEKLLANLVAQAIALSQGKKDTDPAKQFFGNRPSLILLSDQLTPETCGQLLAIYEHKVAFQGMLWNLNSFNQPGVELGKQLANKMMRCFEKKQDTQKDFPLGLTFLKFFG